MNKTPTRNGMQPVHKHDCDHCVYVATIALHDGSLIDAWVHAGRFGSVILRHGSDGPAYWSMDPETLVRNSQDPARFAGGPHDGKRAMSASQLLALWVIDECRRDVFLPTLA